MFDTEFETQRNAAKKRHNDRGLRTLQAAAYNEKI